MNEVAITPQLQDKKDLENNAFETIKEEKEQEHISLKERFQRFFNQERKKKIYTVFYFVFLAAVVAYFIYSKVQMFRTPPPEEVTDYSQYAWYYIPAIYIVDYFRHAWNSLLIAFLLAGIIYEFIPNKVIKKRLGGGKFYHYLLAAVLAPFFITCSCSVIPIYVGILASGASLGVAMTFFLMAPAANFITIMMTGEYIGWNLGLWRLGWSLVAAVISGIIFDQFRFAKELRNQFEIRAPSTSEEGGKAIKRLEVKKTIHDRTENAYTFSWNLVKTVLPRLIIGLVAVSYLIAYIPDKWITDYFTGIRGIVIAALLGGPLYTPTLVEIAMTKSLLLKGMDGATALSFMMGQPYDFVSMVPNSKYFKWKGVIIYSAVFFIFSILSAVIYALIYHIPLK